MTPSSPRPRCYVASPLGFDEGGRHYYKYVLLPALAAVVEPVDPWSWVTDREIADAASQGRARDLWHDIGARNSQAIRQADLLVAYLEGQEVDSGTAAEVGYAAGLGIPCHGLRSDLRQAGERDMTVNLQLEAFVAQSGGRIHQTLDALIAFLSTGPE
jgi:nucleoside 2-deoxyribosyltransferase